MTGGHLSTSQRRATIALALALLAALAWAYAPALLQMSHRWSSDPQYTHAYVVPLFILVVLWFRRDGFPAERIRPSWWGLPLLLAAVACRLAGSMYSFEWLECGSLLPALAGICLLAAGPAVLVWSWPVLALLLFVLPWPWQLDVLLTYPLRRIATESSTYALQTLGIPALARGNIIVINELEIGVVEACSGLGMLMTFFALSSAVALVVQRSLFDRIMLFLSAVPIGVLMNVVRITVTVFLYQFASAEVARVVFHDVAGWVMMPLALGVLLGELYLLDRIWLPDAAAASHTPAPVVPASCSPDLALAESDPRTAKVDRSFQEITDAAS
jgi:exosortase